MTPEMIRALVAGANAVEDDAIGWAARGDMIDAAIAYGHSAQLWSAAAEAETDQALSREYARAAADCERHTVGCYFGPSQEEAR